MTVCTNNKDLISNISSKVEAIKQEELDQHNSKVAQIELLRDDIKAVLLTLTDCVDSSKLGYNFGTVRLIDLRDFDRCFYDYCKVDIEELIYHEHFLKVFNEITLELFGTTYRKIPPSELFDPARLLWDKETLATYTIGWFKKTWMYLSYLWVLALMLFILVVPIVFLMYFVCMFEFKPKFSLAKYKPDCIDTGKWI